MIFLCGLSQRDNWCVCGCPGSAAVVSWPGKGETVARWEHTPHAFCCVDPHVCAMKKVLRRVERVVCTCFQIGFYHVSKPEGARIL